MTLEVSAIFRQVPFQTAEHPGTRGPDPRDLRSSLQWPRIHPEWRAGDAPVAGCYWYDAGAVSGAFGGCGCGRKYEKMGYTSAENGQSWEGKWWVDLGALNFNIWRQNHMRIDTCSRKSCPFPLSPTKETNSVSDDTRSKAAHEKARRAIVRPTATVALAGAYGRSVSQHMTPYVQPLHRWTRRAVKWIMA